MEIAAVLITISTAALGWSFYLAYQAGRILERVEGRLQNHELRIEKLEKQRHRDRDDPFAP